MLVQETRGNYFPYKGMLVLYLSRHALQRYWKASAGNVDDDDDKLAAARTNLEEFEVLGLALTLCS